MSLASQWPRLWSRAVCGLGDTLRAPLYGEWEDGLCTFTDLRSGHRSDGRWVRVFHSCALPLLSVLDPLSIVSRSRSPRLHRVVLVSHLRRIQAGLPREAQAPDMCVSPAGGLRDSWLCEVAAGGGGGAGPQGIGCVGVQDSGPECESQPACALVSLSGGADHSALKMRAA